MSQGPTDDAATPMIMPGNVRAIHVIGLLDEIGELGSGAPVNQVAEKIGGNIDVFLPILNAAEMLGLVRNEDGNLFLTEDGLKVQETTMVKVAGLMKTKLESIEPFRTAIELASRRQGTTAKEVAETLMKRGIQWHYELELDQSMVKSLLIHWGIRADLLTYDGKSGIFGIPTE